jgi:flavin reductase (DIM6/NTAB) family NADH-FMN oxidoreductase RutF
VLDCDSQALIFYTDASFSAIFIRIRNKKRNFATESNDYDMMKSFITAFFATAMLLVAGQVSAQEECGFKKIDVKKDFTENGFQWFREAEILAAGDKSKHNAMTIGWGGIGTLWGRTALTVYVAEKRHTKQFMDEAQYFTVMAFDVEHSQVLNYMGTKSGRDGDKAQALGLHTAYTANGTPYYTEASLVIECKTMYAAPFDPQYFKGDVPKRQYANFPAGLHTMYIGEVVNAWKK